MLSPRVETIARRLLSGDQTGFQCPAWTASPRVTLSSFLPSVDANQISVRSSPRRYPRSYDSPTLLGRSTTRAAHFPSGENALSLSACRVSRSAGDMARLFDGICDFARPPGLTNIRAMQQRRRTKTSGLACTVPVSLVRREDGTQLQNISFKAN